MILKRCNHYGFGTATTFPIEKRYYNGDMPEAWGGPGWYRLSTLVVYCSKCGALLEVNHRKSKRIERIKWRLEGWPNRKYWESLPFLP